MPIYAYRCSSCGHEKDVLQKVSDSPLTQCPACGQETFAKQVTAAGFQLKGSGWYVTDFRNKDSGAKTGSSTSTSSAPAKTESSSSGSGGGSSGEGSTGGSGAAGGGSASSSGGSSGGSAAAAGAT